MRLAGTIVARLRPTAAAAAAATVAEVRGNESACMCMYVYGCAGRIPTEIAMLTELESLCMDNTKLTGSCRAVAHALHLNLV